MTRTPTPTSAHPEGGQAAAPAFDPDRPPRLGLTLFLGLTLLLCLGLLLPAATRTAHADPAEMNAEYPIHAPRPPLLRVATLRGSLVPEYAEVLPGVDIVPFANPESYLFELLSGRVDAVLGGRLELAYLVRRAGIEHLVRFLPGPDVDYKRGVAVPKGREDILARLEPVLNEMLHSPRYQDLVERWYGKPEPYWTPRRLLWLVGSVLAAALLLMIVWHYRSTVALNRRLDKTLKQRNTAFELLSEREQLFHSLFDNSLDAILVLEQGGRILAANPAAAKLLDRPLNEIVGLGRRQIIDMSHKPTVNALAERQRTGRSRGVIRCLRGNGTTVLVEATGAQFTTESGQVRVVSILRDLTERLRRQEELAAANEQLSAANAELNQVNDELMGEIDLRRKAEQELAAANEELASSYEELVQSNDELVSEVARRRRTEDELRAATLAAQAASQAKSEFLANMSHEIRTPLNGLLGMLHLLRGTALDAEQGDMTAVAHEAGRHLLTILNDILDFSRLEAGALALANEEFDPAEVLESLSALFHGSCRDKGIALDLVLDTAVPRTLLGDAARLRQVLFNLVGNAVKFTERGGVRVEISALPRPGPGHVRLLFSVSDTGIGIPDAKLAFIFEPFAQADGSFTRAYQGAGLGLSIVRHLLRLMGGALAVDSEEGRGTTMAFSLSLGLVRAANGDPGDAPEEDCAGLRVLVVEDDRVNRIMAVRFLEKLGHAVLEAADGRQALEILEREPCDCVLMDIQMPVMDGLAATQALRRHERTDLRRLPVIALTAHALPGNREMCLEAGMDAYLTKPLDMVLLARTLRRLCAARRAHPSPSDRLAV